VPIRLTSSRSPFAKARALLTEEDVGALAALVQEMRVAAAAADLDALAEGRRALHELVIERSGSSTACRSAIDRAARAAYFRRDAPFTRGSRRSRRP